MMVGENIKRLRTLKGITQKELGRLSGINEVQIRKYELGKQNPKYETLEKIANGLNVKTEVLLHSVPTLQLEIQEINSFVNLINHGKKYYIDKIYTRDKGDSDTPYEFIGIDVNIENEKIFLGKEEIKLIVKYSIDNLNTTLDLLIKHKKFCHENNVCLTSTEICKNKDVAFVRIARKNLQPKQLEEKQEKK